MERGVLDRVMLAAMGSPHKRQVDGIGGAETLTSKIAVVSKSARPDADLDYLFIQVNPESDIVDYSSNCGNMLSAVGPFALEMGLVPPEASVTRARICNINTDSVIEVILQTPGGEITYEGEAAIDGVPGTAAPVRQNFAGAVGSKSGKLFPTGCKAEVIDGIEVSCIDMAVPMLIVPAEALGRTGHESKAELDADSVLIGRLDRMRVEAGHRMGLGDCSALVVPKPVLVAAPAGVGSIASRDFVPFNCHATYSVTGSIALSVASRIEGTVANRFARALAAADMVKIEHPGGVIEVCVKLRELEGGVAVDEASLLRTCRKLFEGQICIPSRVWDGSRKAANAAQIAAGLTLSAAAI